MEVSYSTMVVNLFGVLLLIVATLYALKKLKLNRMNGDRAIQIVNVVSLGTKEKIALLKVHGTTLLVGITPQTINTLHTFLERDALADVAVAPETLPISNFREQLNHFVK